MDVQRVFAEMYYETPRFKRDGSQFELLLTDSQKLVLGHLSIKVMYVSGHTSACMDHKVGDAVFVGDTLFMPDSGSARCDFSGGSTSALYHSLQRLCVLPGATSVWYATTINLTHAH